MAKKVPGRWTYKPPEVQRAVRWLQPRNGNYRQVEQWMASYLRKGQAIFCMLSPRGDRTWTPEYRVANENKLECGYTLPIIVRPVDRKKLRRAR